MKFFFFVCLVTRSIQKDRQIEREKEIEEEEDGR